MFHTLDTQPFKKDYNTGLYHYVRLQQGLDTLTKHYIGEMKIPRIPIFHPYNPTGDTIENVRSHNGLVGTIVTIRCPQEVFNFLPEPVLTALKENNITSDKTDIFFVTQNMPWKNQQLLFRPQYWIHGQPENDTLIDNATFNLDTPCRIGVFSPTNPNINCDGTNNILSINPVSVSSHPGTDETGKYNMIICSPPNVGILGGIDFDQTDGFYTIAITQDGRAAITLHWLLNEVDQEKLSTISHRVNNIVEFIQCVLELKDSRLNEKNGPLDQLLNLITRKKIYQQPTLILSVPNYDLIYKELFKAISLNDISTFSKLLEIPGIDINADNGSKQTLLHMASVAPSTKFVELLLKKRANPNLGDGNQWTPLDYAAHQGRDDIIDIYDKSGTLNLQDFIKALDCLEQGKNTSFKPKDNYPKAEELLLQVISRLMNANTI